MQTQSTLLATVTTPNPVPPSIQQSPATWNFGTNPSSTQPNQPSQTNDPSKPSDVNARDVSAITLDAKSPCEPCMFQNMMKGIYIPIKYAITDSIQKKFYERKGLPLTSDSALFMGCPISAFGEKENRQKKIYKAPSIPLSIHPERNKTFLEDLQFVETKIQDFLTANTDALKKERDRIRQQVAGGRAMKVDPKDKEPLKYVSMIKTTTVMKDGQAKEYLNINCEIMDKAYKEWYCTKFDVPNDDKKTKKNDKFDDGKVEMVMFPPEAYTNNQLDIKRDADNKIVNGWKVTLQYMVENEIEQILAIPTFGFSKLFWNTDKNEIRLRFYLNSCTFIQQVEKKRQRKLAFGMSSDDFVHSQGSAPPNPKRARMEGDSSVPTPLPTPTAPVSSQPMQPQPMQNGEIPDGTDLTDA